MLLVLFLCLYSGALLVTCLMFLIHTSHLPFSLDKAMAYLLTRARSSGEGLREVRDEVSEGGASDG